MSAAEKRVLAAKEDTEKAEGEKRGLEAVVQLLDRSGMLHEEAKAALRLPENAALATKIAGTLTVQAQLVRDLKLRTSIISML